MRSKTSFFNATIFWKNVKRFWPLWGTYLGIWILALPVTIANADHLNKPLEFLEIALEIASHLGPFMSFGFAVLSAMAVFNFLYSAKSACMICALPLRREGLYLTSFASGLFWLLGANLLVALIGLLAGLSKGMFLLNAMAQWFAIVSLQSLLFYGFACLCAVLTGHLLVLPMVYGVLNFTAVFVEAMINSLRETFSYGATDLWDFAMAPLSPLVYMLSTMGEARDYEGVTGAFDGPGLSRVWFEGWGPLVLYGAVGLLLAFAGLMIFRRRHMETASDVVAVRPLKPVFKYCLAGGCALALGMLLYAIVVAEGNLFSYDSVPALIVCMLVGGFVGYFAAEMLVRKSFRVFKGSWRGFVIFSFAAVALVLCLELDVFGYERKQPDAEEIFGASIEMSGTYAYVEDPESVQMVLDLHEDLIRQKKTVEKIVRDPAGENCRITWLDLDYMLKDGSIMKREYRVPYYEGDAKNRESFLGQADAIVNCEEARLERKKMDIPVQAKYIRHAQVEWFDPVIGEYRQMELKAAEAEELYRSCLLPELESGALGRLWIVADEEYENRVYAATVSIELEKRLEEEVSSAGQESTIAEYVYDYFSTTVTVDAKKTAQWLTEKGIDLYTNSEAEKYDGKY